MCMHRWCSERVSVRQIFGEGGKYGCGVYEWVGKWVVL